MKVKRSFYKVIFALVVILSIVMMPQALANNEHAVSASDMITLVESLKNEGHLTSEITARALTMHLTAVKLFEQQEQKDKVIQHMNSFKQLLEHQLALPVHCSQES